MKYGSNRYLLDCSAQHVNDQYNTLILHIMLYYSICISYDLGL